MVGGARVWEELARVPATPESTYLTADAGRR